MIGDSTSTVICSISKLVANSGVAVLVGDTSMAVFYLPEQSPQIYAIDNFDPFSQARVLSRGIVGDKNGELVVASPIYKQHFSLLTGQCLEDPTVQVPVYRVVVEGNELVAVND